MECNATVQVGALHISVSGYPVLGGLLLPAYVRSAAHSIGSLHAPYHVLNFCLTQIYSARQLLRVIFRLPPCWRINACISCCCCCWPILLLLPLAHQALALGEAVPELEDFEDDTNPDYDGIKQHSQAVVSDWVPERTPYCLYVCVSLVLPVCSCWGDCNATCFGWVFVRFVHVLTVCVRELHNTSGRW